jgi:hypothetical protein
MVCRAFVFWRSKYEGSLTHNTLTTKLIATCCLIAFGITTSEIASNMFRLPMQCRQPPGELRNSAYASGMLARQVEKLKLLVGRFRQ